MICISILKNMSKSRNKNKQNIRFAQSIRPPSSDAGPQVVHLPVRNKGERPLFSFRHICTKDYCAKKCTYEQFKSYSDTLRMLSDLEWTVIEGSPSNGRGYETIPVKSLSSSAKIPVPFSKKEAVFVFRFGGGGRVGSKTSGRIAGIKDGDKFYVLFIDSKLNLYDHGS